MTYTARRYDEIVRDMLTTLTKGTVGEEVLVPPDAVPVLPLAKHPVRRVSHAEGKILVTVVKTEGDQKVTTEVERSYRFTDAEFELIATGPDPNDKDAIRLYISGCVNAGSSPSLCP